MIIHYESILYRIKENPIEHLGRRSVSEIESYFLGYNLARQFWQQPELCHRISREQLRDWFNSKVQLSRQSMGTFCLLLTEDERQAFDLYFELYNGALTECKDDLTDCGQEQIPINSNEIKKSKTLVGFLFEAPIKEKPALYFGNHRWSSGLWAMCNGFVWAEKDLGIENSSDAMNMEFFQDWLDERYPIAKGRTWDRLFDFLALHHQASALKEFYEHLEMFLEGDSPDATSKTIKEIVKNALNDFDKKYSN